MIPIKDNIPTDRFPLVTVGLILLNVVLYVLSIRHGGSLISGPDVHETAKYGAIPYAITHPGRARAVGTIPPWETVFSSMFMHGSILHIAGNMLFLWIFGNNVEDTLGRVRFLGFYLLGGIAALALQVAVGPNAVTPTIGASGAIAAVLGGYILLYPHARVLTFVFIILFFTVIELPAVLMLAVWFAEQALFAAAKLTNPAGGGVAYFAHVGGFVCGLVTIRLLATRRTGPPAPRAVF